MKILSCFFGTGCFSRQLPVPVAIHVAKVLEHQSEPGAQSSLQGAWTAKVLEARDHGRGDLQCTQGRLVPQSSCQVYKLYINKKLTSFIFQS